MDLDKVSISFDDDGRVRVLEADKFRKTEELHKEALAFVTKISDFKQTVQGLVEVLENLSKKIEKEKLKAIGLRNKLQSEAENKTRQQFQLQAVILEKMAELERYNQQYLSLQRVEAEQLALIDKLSNNEA